MAEGGNPISKDGGLVMVHVVEHACAYRREEVEFSPLDGGELECGSCRVPFRISVY